MANNWTDKYLINIEEIDKQHKGFFELWDNKCLRPDLKNHEQLSLIIDKLEDYIEEHFAYEEKLLEKADYPYIENHKAQHRFFIQKVNEMKQELEYMNPLLFEKTAAFMKKWFLSHIMQSDKDYRNFVKETED